MQLIKWDNICAGSTFPAISTFSAISTVQLEQFVLNNMVNSSGFQRSSKSISKMFLDLLCVIILKQKTNQ